MGLCYFYIFKNIFCGNQWEERLKYSIGVYFSAINEISFWPYKQANEILLHAGGTVSIDSSCKQHSY